MSATKKTKMVPFDIVRFLETEDDVQEFITNSWQASIEDECPALFVKSLTDAARARNIINLAATLGVPYRTVYDMLQDAENEPSNVTASFATKLAQALHLPVPEHV